jgi:hypothetical protein
MGYLASCSLLSGCVLVVFGLRSGCLLFTVAFVLLQMLFAVVYVVEYVVGYLANCWLLLIGFGSFPGRFLIAVWLFALCCGLCDNTNAFCCGICGGICCGHFCEIVCGIFDQLLVAFWLRSGCFLVAFW